MSGMPHVAIRAYGKLVCNVVRGQDMRRRFAAVVWQEGDWYVAQCLDVDVASQGETEDEALRNLEEALTLHFRVPAATVLPKVRNVQVDLRAS